VRDETVFDPADPADPADAAADHVDALLADLDDDQRRAVTTGSQLVAVIAGAGSGKTRVLTRRVAYRIVTGSADAAHTVVLTFTREAAGELRRRLPRLGLTDRIVAGTFHSIAQQILRQRWLDTDRAPKGIVTDRRRLVAEVAGRELLDELVTEVDFAMARGLDPDGYTAVIRRGERRAAVEPGRVADALAGYEREKHRRGVLDLDDLLLHLIRELRRDGEFAATIRWRFRHVLVDEAQDLNPLQHALVDLLRQGRDDLFLVGDPAQSIYGFNGSDPTLLTDVSARFPGVEIVRLPVNHRCTPQIVAAGAHALRLGGQPSTIRSGRPDGPVVSIVAHADEDAEAAAIATAAARLDPGLVSGGKVAVLARTHATLHKTRAALEASGVTIRRQVEGAGSQLAPVLAEAYRIKDPNRMRQWARDLLDLADEGDAVRGEIASAAFEFLRDQPTGDGTALRNWVTATDPFGGRVPGVELLTFHGAKGREWHTVHLVGVESSLVPHRSATSNAARAEEARLLYVALTRATDVLTVHWAERRAGYQRKRSPLLAEFASEAPEPAPPPEDLAALERSERAVALERLREWRASAARAAGILPDAVCTDRVLADIAEQRPATPEELDAISGLGTLTSRRLYPGIAAALT
jgi:DNA helicase-2/ATP-dependent DNA helicase PcrA